MWSIHLKCLTRILTSLYIISILSWLTNPMLLCSLMEEMNEWMNERQENQGHPVIYRFNNSTTVEISYSSTHAIKELDYWIFHSIRRYLYWPKFLQIIFCSCFSAWATQLSEAISFGYLLIQLKQHQVKLHSFQSFNACLLKRFFTLSLDAINNYDWSFHFLVRQTVHNQHGMKP